jgi:hypothetical protein
MWQIGYGLTCDPAFEPFATSGDYFTMSNDGIPVIHPSEDLETGGTCWATKVWNPVLTTITCEDCCCELEGVYSYSRCECAAGEWPAWSMGGALIPEEIFLDPTGKVWEPCATIDVKIGPGGDHWCYVKGDEVCETAEHRQVFDDCVDCGEPRICECETPTYTFRDCGVSEPDITVAIDPGDTIGDVRHYCCFDGKTYRTECWEYLGSIGEPLQGSLPACELIETDISCECCDYDGCVWEYVACPGYASVGFPATINYNVGLEQVEGCPCNTASDNVVFSNGKDNWCYTKNKIVCQDPDLAYSQIAIADCYDATYCPDPEAFITFEKCNDEGTIVTAKLSDITLPGGFTINDYIGECIYAILDAGTQNSSGTPVTGECFKVYEGGADEGTVIISQPPAEIIPEGEYTCCDCCLYDCTFEYTACIGAPAGFPPVIYISGEGFEPEPCDETYAPGVIIWTIGKDTWCYEYNDIVCEKPSTYEVEPFAGTACGDEAYCPVSTYRIDPCEKGAPSFWVADDLSAYTGGSWNYDDGAGTQYCFTTVLDAGVPSAFNVGDIQFPGYPTCECCEYPDIWKYESCDDPGTFINIYIDPVTYPIAPTFILTAPGSPSEVCWEIDIPACDEATSPVPPWVPAIGPCGKCTVETYEVYDCEDMGTPLYTIDIGAAVVGDYIVATNGKCYYIASFPHPTPQTVTFTVVSTIADCKSCPDAIQLDSCDGAYTIYTTDTLTPGSDDWADGNVVYTSGLAESDCWKVVSPPTSYNTPVTIAAWNIATEPPMDLDDCDCCTQTIRRYKDCESIETIYYWVDLNGLFDNWNSPEFLRITDVNGVENTVLCLEYVDCDYSGEFTSGNIQEILECDQCHFVELEACDDPGTTVVLAWDELSPAVNTTYLGKVIEISGSSEGATLDGCWTVIDTTHDGPSDYPLSASSQATVAAVAPLTACECCEQDLRIFDLCDPNTCDPSIPAVLLVDMVGQTITPGMYIVAQHIASGSQCCYQLNEELPTCVDPTGLYVGPATGCGDEVCSELVFYQWRECGDDEWINTTTDLSAYAGPNGSPETWITQQDAEGICIEIQETWDSTNQTAFPYELPLAQEYTTVDENTACECCERWSIHQYVICDYPDPIPLDCGALAIAYPAVYIDTGLPFGASPTHILVTQDPGGAARTCCYTLNAEACELETADLAWEVIATDCDDDDCS